MNNVIMFTHSEEKEEDNEIDKDHALMVKVNIYLSNIYLSNLFRLQKECSLKCAFLYIIVQLHLSRQIDIHVHQH